MNIMPTQTLLRCMYRVSWLVCTVIAIIKIDDNYLLLSQKK